MVFDDDIVSHILSFVGQRIGVINVPLVGADLQVVCTIMLVAHTEAPVEDFVHMGARDPSVRACSRRITGASMCLPPYYGDPQLIDDAFRDEERAVPGVFWHRDPMPALGWYNDEDEPMFYDADLEEEDDDDVVPFLQI